MGCISSKAKDTDLSDDGPTAEEDQGLLDNSTINTTGTRAQASEPDEQLEQGDTSGRASTPKSSPHSQRWTGSREGNERFILTLKGKELLQQLWAAYQWKQLYTQSCQEFLAQMDKLFMECQMHLSALSSNVDVEKRKEVDALVKEMVFLRKHWGLLLLPNSVCNAFVRERIHLSVGTENRQFRVDCAQFFEPVPFYGTQSDNGDLMKLLRFSVYDLARNTVVFRYYLEQSNVDQVYHVLCFVHGNHRGQIHPYDCEMPPYWEVRQHMLEDIHDRLASLVAGGTPSRV